MSFRSTIRKTLASTPTRRAAALNSQLSKPTFRAMASIPSTMKGVIIQKTGGSDVMEYRTDLPVPQPKEGEVLVKNDYIGVNYIDTYFRTGLYPAPSFPYILGREAEGTIVATGPSGDLHGLKTGDKVVWMAEQAYAAYSAVAAAKVVKVPSDMPPQIGAAALLQGLTALTLVRESYPVKKGDWILVHAAAGGVGLWLCQLLRTIGAKTIGTASTQEKVDLARKNGAEYMINYSHEDVKQKVMEWTQNEGVAAVFDGVGKATFDVSLECLARKGSMISFGNASGAVPPVTISRLTPKVAKLMRPALFGYLATREEFEGYTKELFDIVLKDKLDVRLHEVYPLSEVKRAHDDLEGRKTTGKLLLDASK